MAYIPLSSGNDLYPGYPWSPPPNEACYIDGFDGDDTIAGTPYNDTIDGGNGHDNLFGGSGNDIIYGANGNDRLDGDYGNDYLMGEAGSDTIYGGFGNDTLIGGGAPAGTADYLYGGEGDDIYYHDSNWGGVTYIYDTDNYSPGTQDRLIFSGVSSIYDLQFFKVSNVDLYIMTTADAADFVNNNGVIIHGYFNNSGAPSSISEVEYLTVAGTTYDLSAILGLGA
ncbi:calcium-binding protein [Azospirillum brasilense]|uniref:calcium-binding protein n=1 Tax=Azospirillum brasilense TaxID=192 RepID=UPI0013B417BC|nr:hypothetical protein [Azospirillum brasilense]